MLPYPYERRIMIGGIVNTAVRTGHDSPIVGGAFGRVRVYVMPSIVDRIAVSIGYRQSPFAQLWFVFVAHIVEAFVRFEVFHLFIRIDLEPVGLEQRRSDV